MSEKRKFNGKIYTREFTYPDSGRGRILANKKAKELRKRGHKARVIQLVRHSRLSEPILVYVKRKRKRKRR